MISWKTVNCTSLAMRCHCNLLDHMPCVMLIGLTRPKKVPATIKICLRGGDCEAKCLRSFSHAKSYRFSFRFTPKLYDLVVVITRESNFLYVIAEINCTTKIKEKTGICKSVVIATVVAI